MSDIFVLVGIRRGGWGWSGAYILKEDSLSIMVCNCSRFMVPVINSPDVNITLSKCSGMDTLPTFLFGYTLQDHDDNFHFIIA